MTCWNRLSWRNDRACLLRSGRTGLAIQVEEPALGGECGAPTSTDRLATQVEGEGPGYEQRAVVLRPSLSLVPIDPSGFHNRSSRDARELASGRLLLLLGLEI